MLSPAKGPGVGVAKINPDWIFFSSASGGPNRWEMGDVVVDDDEVGCFLIPLLGGSP